MTTAAAPRARRAALLLAFLAAACTRAGDPDQVAAWRGGSLSLQELDAHLLATRPRRNDAPLDPAELRRHVLALFARRVLPTPEARQRVLEDPDFARAWRARQDALLAREFLARHNAQFEITAEQARAEFERQRPLLRNVEQRAFRHLFLAFPLDAAGAQRDDRCREAESLRGQIASGASFEELATRFSDSANAIVGGLVGPVTRRQLRGEVAEMVFAQNPGAVSAVLRNAAGCHLFLVEQVMPAAAPRFELVQSRLIERLVEERRLLWRIEQLREQATARGIALPAWLDPAVPPPADLAVDAVVVAFPASDEHDDILGRDVLAGIDRQRGPAQVLADLLQARLLPAAARAAIDPAALAPLLEREHSEQVFQALRARAIERWATEEGRTLISAHYAANPQRYSTDPQVELGVYSWPIGGGDPIAALLRPRQFAAAVAGGAAAAAAWATFAHDPGARREIVPQTNVRALALRRPDLSAVLGRELVEGGALGPFRAGDRLLVATVDVFVPSRPLSLLEAEPTARRDLIAERGDEIEQQWLEALAREHRLRVDDQALARLGQSVTERAARGDS